MNKIPKKLHMIWLRDEEPQTPYLLKLQEFYKGYSIKVWTMEDFEGEEAQYKEDYLPLNEWNDFTKFAVESKNYEALENYLKMKVIYEQGGMFIDVDMDPILRFNPENKPKLQLGFEHKNSITTGFIACEKRNSFAKSVIEYYESLINPAYIPSANVIWTEMLHAHFEDIKKNELAIVKEDIIVYDVNAFGLWYPNNNTSYFIHREQLDDINFIKKFKIKLGHILKSKASPSKLTKQSAKVVSKINKTSKEKLSGRVWTIVVSKDIGMLSKELFEKIVHEKNQKVKVYLHYDNQNLRDTISKIYNVESVEFGNQKSKFRFKGATTIITNKTEKYEKNIRIKFRSAPGRKNIETLTNMYSRLFKSGVENLILDKQVFKIPTLKKPSNLDDEMIEIISESKVETKNMKRD